MKYTLLTISVHMITVNKCLITLPIAVPRVVFQKDTLSLSQVYPTLTYCGFFMSTYSYCTAFYFSDIWIQTQTQDLIVC